MSQNEKSKPKKTFEFLTDVYIRLLCNQKGLDYYESLKLKTDSIVEEKGPLPFSDEELELMIDQYLISADKVIQSTFSDIIR